MHKYYKIFFTFIIAACLIALGLAYSISYANNLEPCKFCLYQRWIYFVVIVISIIGFRFHVLKKICSFIVVLLVLANAGIAFIHLSVENEWFQVSSTCTTGFEKTDNLDKFKEMLMSKEVVACDRIQWTFFTISMAGWNFIYSCVLFVFSLIFSLSFARSLKHIDHE